MAYGVASAQVERSGAPRAAPARRRRPAVGERSDRKALDATEQLVFRAMMSALGWLEGLAAEGDSPLKRLVLAQYRILGSVLGIDAGRGGAAAAGSRHGAGGGGRPALARHRRTPAVRSTDMTIAFDGGDQAAGARHAAQDVARRRLRRRDRPLFAPYSSAIRPEGVL